MPSHAIIDMLSKEKGAEIYREIAGSRAESTRKMDRVFQIVAVIFAGIAAYFMWSGNNDGAFVSAVLGCVSFFLSIRFQVKDRNQARKMENQQAIGDE